MPVNLAGESQVETNNHIPALDGLRTFSILLVLACHLLPLGPKDWQINVAAGAMGMSLFFALSGFLITTNLVNGQNVHKKIGKHFFDTRG